MTAADGPFTVTPRSRPSVKFPTLDEAHAFAKKLMNRDSVPSVITSPSGQIVGSCELFTDAS